MQFLYLSFILLYMFNLAFRFQRKIRILLETIDIWELKKLTSRITKISISKSLWRLHLDRCNVRFSCTDIKLSKWSRTTRVVEVTQPRRHGKATSVVAKRRRILSLGLRVWESIIRTDRFIGCWNGGWFGLLIVCKSQEQMVSKAFPYTPGLGLTRK